MSRDRIRYDRLGYVALNVSDIERSIGFYRDVVGLELCERTASRAFFRCSNHHHDLVLAEGATGVSRISWKMANYDALDALRHKFEDLGVPVYAVSEAEQTEFGISNAFRMVEPISKAPFEFFTDMEISPGTFEAKHTKLVRLGHVVIYAPDSAALERWMVEEMNFRVSDRVDNRTTLLRCFPNPLHHSLGIASASVGGFHHLNFMVRDVDDIGAAMNRLKQAEAPIVFGPGRHPTSNSIFLYFTDPDGFTVEYSFGMEKFPEVTPREARTLPNVLESADAWGGRPSKGYAQNCPFVRAGA